jgi:hypothetical protein
MPEGKRPLGRSRRRWEDNIKMDNKYIARGMCGLDSFGSGRKPTRRCEDNIKIDLEIYFEKFWTGIYCFKTCPVSGFCERGGELWGFE